MKRTGISRRDFLKGTLAGAAGMAVAGLTGCASPAAETVAATTASGGEAGDTAAALETSMPETSTAPAAQEDGQAWDMEAGVVIIGAGGAGLAAACEAAQAGDDVLVLEALMNYTMSNTSLSAGMYQAGGTSVQAAADIEDTTDDYEKLLEVLGDGYDDPALRKVYAQNVAPTLEWLIGLGASFPVEELSDRGTVAAYYDSQVPAKNRMHWAASHAGTEVTTPMNDFCVANGVRIEYETPVKRLIMNEAGEVIGVTAEKNGETLRIKARKAVLISTGGCSRNVDMIKRFLSPQKAHGLPLLHSYGSGWQKGDGITMAQAVGAKTTRIFLYGADIGVSIDESNNSATFPIRGGCALVSSDARIHMTENNSLWPTEFYMAELWGQENGLAWSIWDESNVESKIRNVEDVLEKGLLIKADSYRELAEAIGLEPDVFEETMAEFNEGRENPLTQAPFYAAKCVPVAPDTMGGIGINTNMEVINAFDEVIPRLYAAGTTAGGWRGQINPGCGTAVGWAVTSGRIAGQNMSGLEPWC